MTKKREAWIDHIKVFACILVAVGHLVQSMAASGVIGPADWAIWLNNTLYFFHVPLFFLCSGYVYQKFSRVDSWSTWGRNVFKKAVSLGIPYFTFSLASWLLKAVFSDAVNLQNEGLIRTLFLEPAPPYWFLYVLFLIFLLVPTLRSAAMGYGLLAVALGLKMLRIFAGELPVYGLDQLCQFLFWFVAGMVTARGNVARRLYSRGCRWTGWALAAAFLALSTVTYLGSAMVDLLMGLLGCTAVVLIFGSMEGRHRGWDFMARYTMPIFLMHTIFAAGLRSVLFKLGLHQAAVQIPLGLLISFVGPILAAVVMGKLRPLDIFLYPGKYIRLTNGAANGKER